MAEPRTFKWGKGEGTSLYQPQSMKKENYAFLCEGETDTMRLYEEGIQSVYGLPGFQTFSEDTLKPLREYEKVFVVLDNDANYNVKTTVDQAWARLRGALGSKARRIQLPDDVKDVCEFFDSYSIDTLRDITKNAANGNYHYQSLDLAAPPPEYEWLVKGLICKGDTTLLVGEPNVGKSWLSLSLAVSIADGTNTWLGHEVCTQGRVLYIDEENPHDVVYHRLRQLGAVSFDNIRYLHRQGIRLDRNFDKLLDEAIAYEPTMIVLDSLTRLHTKDENNAGEMAKLFNDSINVICRETGAAVLIIHHTNKVQSDSSYVKTRGSSDIGAAVDSGLEARKQEGNRFNLVHFKSRRSRTGGLTRVEICDTIDGKVEFVLHDEPF
jgi:5S rRNA maturation endonuclease (ribonuclease M5)/archaellum biogenesis ATPase FlaH